MKKQLFLAILFIAVINYACFAEYKANELIIRTKIPLSGLTTAQQTASGTLSFNKDPIFNLYPVKKVVALGGSSGTFSAQGVITKSVPKEFENMYLVQFSDEVNVTDLARKFGTAEQVVWAQPNYIYRTCVVPNDPYYSRQSNLTLIKADKAWDITTGNSAITIAVIDTGVDWQHEDLKNAIWTNTKEIPDNGIDDDKNGYIDDVRGWDFVSVSPNLDAKGNPTGEDYRPRDNNPMDFQGHGTFVSGIIAAQFNSKGIAGIAPACKIMPVRAGFADGSGSGLFETLDIYEAILYAADNKANILNLSWGGESEETDPEDKIVKASIDYALAKGCIVVAAAGNESKNMDTHRFMPASYPGVIAVSALNSDGSVASYTNYGSKIALAAPGTYVISTSPGSKYSMMSGTSFSCPEVVAAAALLLSRNSALSGDDILNILTATAYKPANYDRAYYGAGILDVYSAVKAIRPVITSALQNDDFFELNETVTVNVEDVSGVSVNTITVGVSAAQQVTYNMGSGVFKYTYPALTLDLSKISFLLPGNMKIKVSAANIYNVYSDLEISLNLVNQADAVLDLTGPSTSLPILNYPNPFNPNKTATKICYMLNKTADVEILIYSMNLQLVKRINRNDTVGYYEVEWDGKDSQGDYVPTGVYHLIIKATADGKKIMKKNKIAIVR